MKKIITFVKPILITVIVGGISGAIISRFIDYETLKQPPLSPPSILFPIVWTILYILMGVSYGILKNDGKIDKEINMIYATQLLANVTWPIIFFVFKWRFLAIIWILVLLGLIIYMAMKFYRKNKRAGLLQIPYILWTIFATYLTIGVYVLNN